MLRRGCPAFQLCRRLPFQLCPVHNAPFPRMTWFPSRRSLATLVVSQRHPARRYAPQSPLPEGRANRVDSPQLATLGRDTSHHARRQTAVPACRHHTRTIVRPSSEICARAGGGSMTSRPHLFRPPLPACRRPDCQPRLTNCTPRRSPAAICAITTNIVVRSSAPRHTAPGGPSNTTPRQTL